MRRVTIYPFLAPSLVLYLLADISAEQGEIDARGYLVAGMALVLSAAHLLRVTDAEDGAMRRVRWLGFSAALALTRLAADVQLDVAVEASSALGMVAASVLTFDLALSVPDVTVPARYLRPARWVTYVAGGIAAVLSLLAAGPVVSWFGLPWLVPAAWAQAAPVSFAVSVAAALLLRMTRRRRGSTPEALASNVWASLGVVPAVLLVVLQSAHEIAPGLRIPVDTRMLAPFVAASLYVGHIWLIDPRRRLASGPAVREFVAAAVSCIAVAGPLVVVVRDRIPTEPIPLASAAAATLLVGLMVFQALRPSVMRALAPFRGRLLIELWGFPRVMAGVHGLLGLARTELSALRRASGDPSGEPLLYALDPLMSVRIDAAGEAHTSEHPLAAAILDALRATPGEVIVHAPLAAKIVRQPKLRPLVHALEELDALCVVPLVHEGELEGALVVPRGLRKRALTLEELLALQEHSRLVAALLAMFCAHARAEQRAHGLIVARDRADAAVERLTDDLARARADLELLASGRDLRGEHSELIAYSPAMRALVQRLRTLAGHDVPVLLQAESGLELESAARFLHAASGRGAQPLVVVDCAALRAQDAMAELFGGDLESRRAPGMLRVAGAGTLLLMDVPALPADVQRQLAAALASRSARTQDGREGYALQARVVATCRPDVREASAAAEPEAQVGFEPELHARLEAAAARLPSLRERAEDIESLALLAVDRACRRYGRAALGLSPDALDALRLHVWQGNVAELQSVLERAVLACREARISAADLPLARRVEPTADALEGTLEEIERKALEHALSRALGNKSEAARLLGLPRTTFLDKLRRHKLDDGTRDSQLPPN